MSTTRSDSDTIRAERPGIDAFSQGDSSRIAVSGASGFIGAALCSFLAARGHRVDRLVRREPRPETTEIRWSPAAGEIDAAGLEGVDAVVNLSGEDIASGRWTAARKDALVASRVGSTQLLCETLARLGQRPGVLINASAVGYYGDRGDDVLTEESEAGSGFLCEVCTAWEAATQPARDAGIRVVNLRIGVVLSPEGGALARMLPAFRHGLGGRLGSGRQHISWITRDDLVAAVNHLLFATDVSGPVNAVAPEPVTNARFTEALGHVLQRPAWFAMPAAGVRLVFGEMGEEVLLASARVQPKRLLASGFSYGDPQLEPALVRMLRATPANVAESD